ncbi:MAG: HAD family hydrolase [Anaerolineales bacterium]|nr:HAD family hydrolase [Anaerolineales bacterium]
MPLDIHRIHALCFDVDGTLSDTDDLFVQKTSSLFKPVKYLFRDHDYRRAARRFIMWIEAPGNALMSLPDILGLDDEVLALVEWMNRHRTRPMKHFLLIPGVQEMLQRLHGHYPMAVVSARDERSTRMFLDQFELTPLFQVIVSALTARHTKPYPDPVFFAADAMGVPPESCLMVGDTTVDIRAGKAAGAQTVAVLCGFGEEAEFSRNGADMILPSTADLNIILGNRSS